MTAIEVKPVAQTTFSAEEIKIELDAAFFAQEHCRALWGAARGRSDWRMTHDGFIAGYKARNVAMQSAIDALQARIDELEAQLFISQADAALPLYEVMQLEPVPPFPSIRP